jgi:hypothetical protein
VGFRVSGALSFGSVVPFLPVPDFSLTNFVPVVSVGVRFGVIFWYLKPVSMKT